MIISYDEDTEMPTPCPRCGAIVDENDMRPWRESPEPGGDLQCAACYRLAYEKARSAHFLKEKRDSDDPVAIDLHFALLYLAGDGGALADRVKASPSYGHLVEQLRRLDRHNIALLDALDARGFTTWHGLPYNAADPAAYLAEYLPG